MEPLARIEEKLDRIIDRLSEHSASLAVHSTLHSKNTEDLEEHIKRTKNLEDRVEPIEQHVKGVHKVMKAGLWLLGTAVAAYIGSIFK